MANKRQNSNSKISAIGYIKVGRKGGYLLWVQHPNNEKLVGFLNYKSIAEAIEQQVTSDVIDAVGQAADNVVKLRLDFANDFTTKVELGRETINLDINRPIDFEIL